MYNICMYESLKGYGWLYIICLMYISIFTMFRVIIFYMRLWSELFIRKNLINVVQSSVLTFLRVLFSFLTKKKEV